MEKKGSTETGSRKSDSVYIAMDWNVLKDITNVENRVKCLKLAVKKSVHRTNVYTQSCKSERRCEGVAP